MKKKIILVLNSGSSSVKYSLFENLNLIKNGIEERIGLGGGAKNHQEAIRRIFDEIISSKKIKGLSEIKAIGHRVVHGGDEFREPIIITKEIVASLKKFSRLAPLHNPPNILGIETCQKLLPEIKNIAVFDTGFYASLPKEAFVYALPYQLYQEHKIRRYGFHGISHQYIARESEKILGKSIERLITCHLGAGSSITAIKNGQPIDTSMGFTPLEGLVMETRSGNIDPAIPLYLITELKYSPQEVDEILNKKSGYIGICNHKDFREILKSEEELPKLAYQIYLRSVVKHIGSYIALLQGLDSIVFTAGIGEGSARFRKDVMNYFKYLGVEIDEKKNEKNEVIISTDESKIKILVVHTDEELMIAHAVSKLVN